MADGDGAEPASKVRKLSPGQLIGEMNRQIEEFSDREQRLQEMEKRLLAVTKEPSDVLEINAGGQIFAVRRSTLCLATDSLLAALFSGSWDAGQHRDSQGRPFLDIDPYIFDKILNFLRQKSIEGPESPAPRPVISLEKDKEFSRVVEYYGLGDCLYGSASNAMGVKVQSFSLTGDIVHSTGEYLRGYTVCLQARTHLQAILVGAASPVQVIIGTGTNTILKEVTTVTFESSPLNLHFKGDEASISQIANVDIMLEAQAYFIMVRGKTGVQIAFVDEGRVVKDRNAGPFLIKGKYSIPPMDNSYNLCMRVVYKDMP